jgi:hypothetical protein
LLGGVEYGSLPRRVAVYYERSERAEADNECMPRVATLAPLRDARPRPAVRWRERAAAGASALVVLGIASVGVASAAGQDGSTSGLSGGSAVAAACGSGIAAAYTTTYSATIPDYSVTQVNLASIPAGCLSKAYRIQLTGSAGAAVGSEMTGTLPASGTTANISTSGNVDASLVTGISVVIS